MTVEELRTYAEKSWPDPDIPTCPVCKRKLQTSFEVYYAHLLEHRIKFLEKVIRLYCDCDCDKPPKPGEEHWAFCRRKISETALVATLEQMIPGTGK